jgi:hypothetical protein
MQFQKLIPDVNFSNLVSVEIGRFAVGGGSEAEAGEAVGRREGDVVEGALSARRRLPVDDENRVGHREGGALGVDGLATVGALVLVRDVAALEAADAVVGHLRALLGNVSPVETPVDLGRRHSDGRAGDREDGANIQHHHRCRWHCDERRRYGKREHRD